MIYQNIYEGRFIERPNRFIAHVEINGAIEIVHVKNTGRCKELLTDNAIVYLEKSMNPNRKTAWDLIAVKKGDKIINMDSQVTNHVVKEWIIDKAGFGMNIDYIKPEVRYKNSRFDLYLESGERKIFIEVKGVTLEEDGVLMFPDAPSLRAIKHIEELIDAKENGYEVYIFFVVQMKGAKYFTPNKKRQPEFADALLKARDKGVNILVYDCDVLKDEISISEEVQLVLGEPILYETRDDVVEWFKLNKRELPWRENVNPYKVWVSEIMLQQTRVEAVKPYYKKFLEEIPDIQALAEIQENKLLKLWEGLGYYNRVKNMQLAAKTIERDWEGEFPLEYKDILSLKGIGTYTAGAISAFAYHQPLAAVDGNVLRVLSRLTGDDSDITKEKVKLRYKNNIEEIIPNGEASNYNQGLIEIGALICIPNGKPKCEECPMEKSCITNKEKLWEEIPVKKVTKKRRIEELTFVLFRDVDKVAINKRSEKGLLGGMYEFPNFKGHLTSKELIIESKKLGMEAIKIEEIGIGKHIFSHVEWNIKAYIVKVDELENKCNKGYEFVHPEKIQSEYAIPSAFKIITDYILILIGNERLKKIE